MSKPTNLSMECMGSATHSVLCDVRDLTVSGGEEVLFRIAVSSQCFPSGLRTTPFRPSQADDSALVSVPHSEGDSLAYDILTISPADCII